MIHSLIKSVRIFLVYSCLLASFSVVGLAQQPAPHTPRSEDLDIAYIATVSVNNGINSNIYYDHGKYSIFGANSFYIYDGTDAFLRWSGNTKTHTVVLDSPLGLKRLYEMIKRDGLPTASQRSGIDQSLLERFANLWIPGLPPRVLSHPLRVFAEGQRDFPIREFAKSGTQKVAGFDCDVFVSRKVSSDKLWVEPTTHCILRQHTTDPSGNPRIPPRTLDWNVIKFKPLSSVNTKWFRIPPGFTALLPGILRDLPLSVGVQRKIQTGKNSFVDADIAQYVAAWERYRRYKESH